MGQAGRTAKGRQSQLTTEVLRTTIPLRGDQWLHVTFTSIIYSCLCFLKNVHSCSDLRMGGFGHRLLSVQGTLGVLLAPMVPEQSLKLKRCALFFICYQPQEPRDPGHRNEGCWNLSGIRTCSVIQLHFGLSLPFGFLHC